MEISNTHLIQITKGQAKVKVKSMSTHKNVLTISVTSELVLMV